MNAERLHSILRAVQADLEATRIVPLLDQLASHLDEVVSNPQEPSNQQALERSRAQVFEALTKSGINDFSPAWREALQELGLSDLGVNLRDRIEEIFMRHQITPAVASQEVREIAARIGRSIQAADQFTQSADFLMIGQEELLPGEFEVGVLIPRTAVHNHLGELGNEFEQIEKILRPFIELATRESPPPIEVRSISSSEFQVLLDMAPVAAVCIATAVSKVLGAYKTVLEIRLLHEQLKEKRVPDTIVEDLKAHQNQRMSDEIEIITDEILRDHSLEDRGDGRVHELRTSIRFSLNSIANRIDRGFNIEVRTAPRALDSEVEADDSDGGGESNLADDPAAVIRSLADSLQFMNISGEPILELPEHGAMDAGPE